MARFLRVFGAIVVLSCAFLGVSKFEHHRRYMASVQQAEDRIRRNDPLPKAGALSKIPCLLVVADADRTVDPKQNGLALQKRLGSVCQVIRIPGADHGDNRCYAPAPIMAFLRAHLPAGASVVTLHGAYSGASKNFDWRDSDAAFPNRRALGKMLHLQYEITSGAMGGG